MFGEHHKGKHIFGTVKVGERGQIVIPKKARDIFGIEAGDVLMVVGDEKRGLGLISADAFYAHAVEMMKIFDKAPEEAPEE